MEQTILNPKILIVSDIGFIVDNDFFDCAYIAFISKN